MRRNPRGLQMSTASSRNSNGKFLENVFLGACKQSGDDFDVRLTDISGIGDVGGCSHLACLSSSLLHRHAGSPTTSCKAANEPTLKPK